MTNDLQLTRNICTKRKKKEMTLIKNPCKSVREGGGFRYHHTSIEVFLHIDHINQCPLIDVYQIRPNNLLRDRIVSTRQHIDYRHTNAEMLISLRNRIGVIK